MAFSIMKLRNGGLTNLLDFADVDRAKWRPKKVEADLLQDLESGVRKLTLALLTQVVKMQVLANKWPGEHLVELGRRLASGEEVMEANPRGPAGKVKADESPDQAFVRELREELHLDAMTCDYTSFKPAPEVEDSRSYGGILGVYQFFGYRVRLNDAELAILDSFWIPERERFEIPDGEGKGTTLYFQWAPLPTGH